MPEQMKLEKFVEECEKELLNGRVYNWKDIPKMPSTTGVYMISHDESVVYIGESKNIRHRIQNNHAGGKNSSLCDTLGEEGIDPSDFLPKCNIRCLVLEYGRKEVEEELIKRYKPRYNKLS